jgi:Pyruvate/2-oxoacid:ferredoxin oxidoreductase delta subunit
MKRNIIRIDQEKCNGCGQCVIGCAEGAIQLVNGKAALISETYCDGLGACIGECPVGALTIEEREAPEYNQTEVDNHLANIGRLPHSACPGSATVAQSPVAALGNWPVQLSLVPVTAPYLERASLLIAADCTAFAFPDFHRRFLKGKVALIGCPKLDDAAFYREKLAKIIQTNQVEFIHVVYMEVPCCGGLVRLVQGAVADSGCKVPVKLTKIGIAGEVLAEDVL